MEKVHYLAEGYRKLNNAIYYKKLNKSMYPETAENVSETLLRFQSSEYITEKQFGVLITCF